MTRIESKWAWIDGRMIRDAAIMVDDLGTIRAADHTSLVPIQGDDIDRFESGLVLPGGVNSHSHAWQILLRGRLDSPAGFRDWVDHGLYPFLETMDDEALEAGALLAFAEMALSGVTTVGEFHYVHNPPPGAGPGARSVEERDASVIRAARRVGLRVVMLRGLYDLGDCAAQTRFQETPVEAIERLSALDALFEADPCVSVAPAPHSLHGASETLIRAAAQWAVDRGRPLHIHLAEQRDDIDLSMAKYGVTPLAALDSMGVVAPNLVCVHGIWLDPAEVSLLGKAGAGLAYNPTSNMALGDGTAPLDELVQAGVRVSLGTDGACANNQVDLFAEARRAEHMQRLRHLRMGVLPRALCEAVGEPTSSGSLLRLATENGAANLGLKTGRIAIGCPADLIVLDTDDLSLLPHDPDGDGEDLLSNVVYAMSVRSALRASYVAGNPIVQNGRLAQIDPAEITARVAAQGTRSRRSNG